MGFKTRSLLPIPLKMFLSVKYCPKFSLRNEILVFKILEDRLRLNSY